MKKSIVKLNEKDEIIKYFLNYYFNNKVNPKCISPYNKIMQKIEETCSKLSKKYYTYPINIKWLLTSDCNLRCRHCYFYGCPEMYEPVDELSTEKAFEFVDDIADKMSVVNIVLSGGEPFLRKDFFEILQKIKSKNLSVIIQSNGTLITPEIAKRLKPLLNPNMDSIQISLDGAVEKDHDAIRGEGAFKKAIEGVKNLTNEGIYPNSNLTVTSKNISNLPLIAPLAQEYKIKRVSLTKFFAEDGQQELVPDAIEVINQFYKICQNKNKYPDTEIMFAALRVVDLVNNEHIRKHLKNYVKTDKKEYLNNCDDCMCHKHEQIMVNAKGDISLCVKMTQPELILGNISEKPIMKIWENITDNIVFQKRDPKKMICSKCDYISICKGDCPAIAYSHNGNFYDVSGLCAYSQKLI